ncbi:MAG TPA: FG-GAP-like repeat-containing protein [Fluviicola sp.]|nr:FG-GAP-like repeat-containing protein [Fluviicola sp.]
MKKPYFLLLAIGFPLLSTAQVTFTATTYNQIPSGWPSYNLATVDMNGDYLDDIVVVSATEITILYQQAAGGFTSTTITTSMADYTPDWSMAVGDIDKNGFNDLLYGSGGGVTFMKANATGTAYTEVSFNEYVFSQRTNFVDINNDGHLDAYVCHDVAPNVYYLNDGNGNLTFHQGGIGDHPEGGNYGSIWVDYDNDGDQDCFIAKCRGGGSTASIDELHQNDGNGNFTNVAVAANMANADQSWSGAWNDYDNDGDMDAMVGASSAPNGETGVHSLMRNNGDGTFTNITAGSGWENNNTLSIEHVSYDFDNNGFADMFGGSDYLAGGGGKFMYNNGDMTFTPFVDAGVNISDASIGDLNNDGFLDLRHGQTVYYNNGNNNNWVKIQLKGIASNFNGIGARVEIYGDWGKQIRDVRSGDGFAHMNTLNVHFGLGTATEIDSVRVLWPSGHVDVVDSPAINDAVTIVEGTDPLSLVEIGNQKLDVFPNPATAELSISNIGLLNVTEVEVYNMHGEKMQAQSGNFGTINVSSLAEGAYILLIRTTEGNTYAESFVKKN